MLFVGIFGALSFCKYSCTVISTYNNMIRVLLDSNFYALTMHHHQKAMP